MWLLKRRHFYLCEPHHHPRVTYGLNIAPRHQYQCNSILQYFKPWKSKKCVIDFRYFEMSAFQMLVSKHESLKPHFHHRHQGLTYVQINIIHHTAKINLPVQGMSFFLFLKVLKFSPNIMWRNSCCFFMLHWTNLLNLCRCFYCSGN